MYVALQKPYPSEKHIKKPGFYTKKTHKKPVKTHKNPVKKPVKIPEICKKSRDLQEIPRFARNPEICKKSRDF